MAFGCAGTDLLRTPADLQSTRYVSNDTRRCLRNALNSFAHCLHDADKTGGHVEKNEKGWGLGVRQFQLMPDAHNYLRRLHDAYAAHASNGRASSLPEVPTALQMLYIHQDHVAWDSFPASLKLLGGNAHAPVLGTYDGQSVLTVQGHPEFNFGIIRAAVEKITKVGQLPGRLPAGESFESVERQLAVSTK